MQTSQNATQSKPLKWKAIPKMTNPFSLGNLAPAWERATEILKGDFPGHPFRGNQYVDAISVAQKALDRAETAHDMAASSHTAVARGGDRPEYDFHQAIADNHRVIADLHSQAADDLRARVGQASTSAEQSGIAGVIDAHKLASYAHERAAHEHAVIANGNSADDSSATRSALRTTGDALSKTETAKARIVLLGNRAN